MILNSQSSSQSHGTNNHSRKLLPQHNGTAPTTTSSSSSIYSFSSQTSTLMQFLMVALMFGVIILIIYLHLPEAHHPASHPQIQSQQNIDEITKNLIKSMTKTEAETDKETEDASIADRVSAAADASANAKANAIAEKTKANDDKAHDLEHVLLMNTDKNNKNNNENLKPLLRQAEDTADDTGNQKIDKSAHGMDIDVNDADDIKLAKTQRDSSYDYKYWIDLNLKPNEFDGDDEAERAAVFAKRMAIRDTFIDAYNAYDHACHGQDELVPIGAKCHNWVGMGLTLVDSLDTMYIMGTTDLLSAAHDWVASSLNVGIDRSVSFFETTIRCLGGLMSIHDLTKDAIYLTKAVDLAQRMLPAFNTPNGLPLASIHLRNGHTSAAGWAGGSVLLAEVGTVQLEFQSTADRSGITKLGEPAAKVFETVDGFSLPMKGQFPIYLKTSKALAFANSHITWGAMGDSFYEYLLKFWVYTGKRAASRYRRMYVAAVEGMFENLYKLNAATQLHYIAESRNGRTDDKFDELACFTGGMLALGVMHGAHFDDAQRTRHTQMAVELGETCYQMFARQKVSGVAPEFVRFNANGMHAGTDYYILRPETVETMMYLYRLTGDAQWRQKGWTIYENIVRTCKVTDASVGVGYAPILHVSSEHPRQDPKGVMHSFFLAETLKYLYLLFSNDKVVDLHHFVFNTEAHPILIPRKTFAPK